jgi:hypothetical protein
MQWRLGEKQLNKKRLLTLVWNHAELTDLFSWEMNRKEHYFLNLQIFSSLLLIYQLQLQQDKLRYEDFD